MMNQPVPDDFLAAEFDSFSQNILERDGVGPQSLPYFRMVFFAGATATLAGCVAGSLPTGNTTEQEHAAYLQFWRNLTTLHAEIQEYFSTLPHTSRH